MRAPFASLLNSALYIMPADLLITLNHHPCSDSGGRLITNQLVTKASYIPCPGIHLADDLYHFSSFGGAGHDRVPVMQHIDHILDELVVVAH